MWPPTINSEYGCGQSHRGRIGWGQGGTAYTTNQGPKQPLRPSLALRSEEIQSRDKDPVDQVELQNTNGPKATLDPLSLEGCGKKQIMGSPKQAQAPLAKMSPGRFRAQALQARTEGASPERKKCWEQKARLFVLEHALVGMDELTKRSTNEEDPSEAFKRQNTKESPFRGKPNFDSK